MGIWHLFHLDAEITGKVIFEDVRLGQQDLPLLDSLRFGFSGLLFSSGYLIVGMGGVLLMVGE